MKTDEHLLKYILEQIEMLENFYKGKSEEEFLRDDVLKDACLMKLVVIGEYSSKISNEQRSRFSEVEWQLLKAARNYYAHNYGGITWPRVWETLSEDVPTLKIKIKYILEVLERT